jgi:8-oxo-dGTP pyrophosphatase MutT (NUDIX family)
VSDGGERRLIGWSEGTGVEPQPAATVVPLRTSPDGFEVLLLRRRSGGSFGGMWVFPGGQVDEADRRPGETGAEGELAAARRAAVREANEEAGLELDPDGLVALSFWLPPTEAPKRFATWFFVALVAESEVVVDDAEVLEHRWLSPAGAMAARAAGEIDLAPPTFMTLWSLSAHEATADVLAAAAGQGEPGRFTTRMIRVGDGRMVGVWEQDAAYEAGDLDAPGARYRLLIGPDGWSVDVRSSSDDGDDGGDVGDVGDPAAPLPG